MITAETLQRLIAYNAPTLNSMARANGYKGPAFSSCKFLGISNGGQFVYMAVFLVEGGTDSTKVYVTYEAGNITAEVDKVEVWAYN
jgi:hypothetical protein